MVNLDDMAGQASVEIAVESIEQIVSEVHFAAGPKVEDAWR